jgi:hypothetical protein
MKFTSMNREKLKESRAEVANNEVSKNVRVKSIKRMSVLLNFLKPNILKQLMH